MVEPRIIDRGRGPEIAGTRITVFDILDYLQDGWHPVAIAAFFRVSSREVDEAIRYIEDHKEEVLRGIRPDPGQGRRRKPARAPSPARCRPRQVPGAVPKGVAIRRPRGTP